MTRERHRRLCPVTDTNQRRLLTCSGTNSPRTHLWPQLVAKEELLRLMSTWITSYHGSTLRADFGTAAPMTRNLIFLPKASQQADPEADQRAVATMQQPTIMETEILHRLILATQCRLNPIGHAQERNRSVAYISLDALSSTIFQNISQRETRH